MIRADQKLNEYLISGFRKGTMTKPTWIIGRRIGKRN